MLDWKNRKNDLRGRVDDSVDDVRSYLGGLWLSRALGGLLGLYLLAALVVGWYWSQEPALFPVQQNAKAAAELAQRPLVSGYTTVETVKSVAGSLLDKDGGYLSNDLAPPGLWLDNMPSWEYGVLVQVRDVVRALRKDFARSQSQSTEDPDLAKAEPRFNFDNKSWALPATEAEYREGIKSLDRYQRRLADPSQPNAQFYTRADNLNNWLGDVATRLGSLSQRLSASVGRVRLNTDLKGDAVLAPGERRRSARKWCKPRGCRSTTCSTRPVARPGRCRTCCAPSRWILPMCWRRRTPPSACGRSFASWRPPRNRCGAR